MTYSWWRTLSSTTHLTTSHNKSVDGWDSVKQLALTTALEDTFDIMLDAEDILELTSYTKGKEMLKKYEVEL